MSVFWSFTARQHDQRQRAVHAGLEQAQQPHRADGDDYENQQRVVDNVGGKLYILTNLMRPISAGYR